ncbi:hypothetical protein GCM10011414_28830 [Croceivirga lutea]|uniref:BfmA/BtgA family mobilization protein n=1 Tax=Croceivirga lutea TaxID=1775167 RepID=UPI001639C47B|nr:BfmA/BtgA family mobilization protein [Croceivirga lutea]GGG57216.1 hypothetical protein GCM10011414_28830 [Croceivirga lutea]
MDKEYLKERFVTLRLKEPVAEEFRRFAKKEGQSQSVTLQEMLDFFKRNQINPKDEVTTDLKKLETKLLKRINAVMSIIRDIEKTQTLPTLIIVKSFLEGISKEETPSLIEKDSQPLSLEEELEQLNSLNKDLPRTS